MNAISHYVRRESRYLIRRIAHLLWLRRRQARQPLGRFGQLPYATHAMHKLCTEYHFETVLDVGSGAGLHAACFAEFGKQVVGIDTGDSVYFRARRHDYDVIRGNFLQLELERQFDCVWASHVLEHAPDVGQFLRRIIDATKPDGVIAITVPPLKPNIVGGHLNLWNPGLLLYNLIHAGLDCRHAAVLRYGYNISVITHKRPRPAVELQHDAGDIDRLAPYFPLSVAEAFDGRLMRVNW